jgi:hypothetical protein
MGVGDVVLAGKREEDRAMAKSQDELPLFGPEWCAKALEVANDTPDIVAGSADPTGFQAVWALECTDRIDVASWVEFRAGRVYRWESGPVTVEGYRTVARAPVAVWRSAAQGEENGTDLLLGHHIKVKDPRNRIASNYRAFDALLASWIDIPTLWP